ncbi:hypothetical protein NHX12_032318 [Muraenolepis orangiensis]|uniref:Uncharacterized protein n=1 Tax=Muraenolepis orangiensis TaxID=630683 RepID=A0A9Q0II44_9TELE|nr:hypothetical protein NHX12_032318 [Muraenolepis orangiensis]
MERPRGERGAVITHPGPGWSGLIPHPGPGGLDSSHIQVLGGLDSSHIQVLGGLDSSHIQVLGGLDSSHIQVLGGLDSSHIQVLGGLDSLFVVLSDESRTTLSPVGTTPASLFGTSPSWRSSSWSTVSVLCHRCHSSCSAKKGPTQCSHDPLQQYPVGSPMERVSLDILGPYDQDQVWSEQDVLVLCQRSCTETRGGTLRPRGSVRPADSWESGKPGPRNSHC